jgi:hypothetical protein
VSPEVEESGVKYPPSVLERPGQNLRYMRRRRVNRTDRNGDPLDGLVNLFAVAIVLAVGLLLAALAGMGLTDVLTGKDMTIVTNPGTSSMEVLVRQDGQITRLVLQPGQQVSGAGTLVGQFYQLADGSTVYVPASGSTVPTALPSGSASTPGFSSPSAAPSTTPSYGPTETPPAGAPTTPPGRQPNPTPPGTTTP